MPCGKETSVVNESQLIKSEFQNFRRTFQKRKFWGLRRFILRYPTSFMTSLLKSDCNITEEIIMCKKKTGAKQSKEPKH